MRLTFSTDYALHLLMCEDWIGAGGNDQISVDIMRQCRYALCRIAGQQRRFANPDGTLPRT